jgi:hypothetical protein
LHGPWVALHVHDAQSALGRGCRIERVWLGKCPDIIEKARPGLGSGAHDLRLAGVDGNNSVGLSSQAFDDRDNAPDFFFYADWIGTRAGGLATHIDDPSALLDHAPAMGNRCLHIQKPAAV